MTTICGTDVHILRGEYPVAPGRIVGHEPVGVIHELGTAVSLVTRNSSTSAGKSPEVRFICSARSSSTTFTTNSPVASMLRSVESRAVSASEWSAAVTYQLYY